MPHAYVLVNFYCERLYSMLKDESNYTPVHLLEHTTGLFSFVLERNVLEFVLYFEGRVGVT